MRHPGRGVALSMVSLAIIVAAHTLHPGNSTSEAYARPLAAADGGAIGRPAALPQFVPASAPTWDVYPPGSTDAVILPGRISVRVPILMYHYIRVPPSPEADRLGYKLSVSPQDFGQQMDYLAREGFHPVTISDLQGYLEGRGSLPDRPVVLTFDDGYADLYSNAFPVLREHNFKAVAYLVSGFVGAAGRNVTPEQVREMDAYGIEIGAHTFSHADLTKLDPAQLRAEVAGSRSQLEALLGHAVPAFCYPAGRYNAQVVAAVEAAGFSNATTTQEGASHTLGDRFTWSRVRVSGGESLADFAAPLRAPERGVVPDRPEPIRVPRAYPLLFLGVLAGLK